MKISFRCMSEATEFNELSSEEFLLTKAKCGNELAMVELWTRHGKTARSAIWRIMNNWEDTEDLLQETYMKSYLHLDQFDGRSKFSTWLVRIGINSALMLIRKRRSRSEILLASDEVGNRVADFPDDSEDVELSYLRSERAKHLRGAVRNLKPSLRQVIELKHELDLSVEDIAAKTGLSVSAVKSRLLRARLVLGRTLACANKTRSSAA
jgi:RNA polymerase sigma-70 factor (ECF subfamily)